MGFIYNGISSQSMRVKARLSNWQAVPSPQLVCDGSRQAGRRGLWHRQRREGHHGTLQCLSQRSFAELVQVLDEMADWLNPDFGTQRLILDDVPDRYFSARLYEAVDCERLIRSAGSFDLRFVCRTHTPMRSPTKHTPSP